MSELPDAVLARARATQLTPPQDKLDALRTAAKQLRDLNMEIADLEERLSEKKASVKKLSFEDLPTLFDETNVRSITIEAEGNQPAYTATATPYYHANIRADWPDDQKLAAFNWLESNDHGDLIKTVITVELGRGDRDKAKKVIAALDKMKVDFNQQAAVPWNTLTAFLREQIEEQQQMLPLDLLGATVGRIVKLKAAKK